MWWQEDSRHVVLVENEVRQLLSVRQARGEGSLQTCHVHSGMLAHIDVPCSRPSTDAGPSQEHCQQSKHAYRDVVEGGADVDVGGVDGVVGRVGPGSRQLGQLVLLHVKHLQVQRRAEAVRDGACTTPPTPSAFRPSVQVHACLPSLAQARALTGSCTFST